MILGLCGLFWAVGVFWADLRKILVGAPCCNGIHFELKLLLALLLVFVFFCLLWLAWAGFGLLWLLWLLALSVPLLFRFCLCLGAFFPLVALLWQFFSFFLTPLTLFCIF